MGIVAKRKLLFPACLEGRWKCLLGNGTGDPYIGVKKLRFPVLDPHTYKKFAYFHSINGNNI